MEEKAVNSQEATNTDAPVGEKTKSVNPVLWTTRVVFLIAALIFAWYIYSDRFTPYTSLGRITEIIVPLTPRVSGYLIDVKVRLHSIVKTNQLLFQIDTSQYALAVKKAEANLENVTQQLGAQDATVKAAASNVGVAKAQLDRAQRNFNRVQRIVKKNPGALSQADIDRVETSLDQAKEKLANAQANLVKSKNSLELLGQTTRSFAWPSMTLTMHSYSFTGLKFTRQQTGTSKVSIWMSGIIVRPANRSLPSFPKKIYGSRPTSKKIIFQK
jgi:multidrug resistance efflux pump